MSKITIHPEPEAAHGRREMWAVLIAAVLGQIAVSSVEQGFPTLAGFIKDDLDTSTAVAGFVVSAVVLGEIAGFYQAGRIADDLGGRTVSIIVCIGTGVCLIVAALLPLLGVMMLLFVAGIFLSGATPAGVNLIRNAFPIDRHEVAFGARQAAVPIGGIIGAAILPVVADPFGWRTALAVGAACTIAGALPFWILNKRSTSLPVQNNETQEPGTSWKGLARDKDILLISAWGCALSSGQYTILAYLGLDAHETARISLANGAILIVVAQVGGAVGRISWAIGTTHAWGGKRRPARLAIAVSGAGIAACLALLPRETPFWAFALIAFVAGLTLIGWQGVWVASLSEAAGSGQSGAVLGFALTLNFTSVAASPPIYGGIRDLTGNFTASWLLLAGALILAMVPAWMASDGRGPN